MKRDEYTDDYIRDILTSVKTIAIVGASANPIRPSFFVMKYLQAKGYHTIPVNPGLAGQQLLGEMVYGALKDIDDPVDMVDIFRGSDAAFDITKQAIKIGAKVVWMQLTVINKKAAKRAKKAGLKVVMNRCPKIEYGRLSGEIGWAGINSRTISSQRGKLLDGFQHRRI